MLSVIHILYFLSSWEASSRAANLPGPTRVSGSSVYEENLSCDGGNRVQLVCLACLEESESVERKRGKAGCTCLHFPFLAGKQCREASHSFPHHNKRFINLQFLQKQGKDLMFFLQAARSNWCFIDNTAVNLNMYCLLVCLYFSKCLCRVSEFLVSSDSGVSETLP